MSTISGFSKLSKAEKMHWVADTFFNDSQQVIKEWSNFWHPDATQQDILDGFSENTISNFPLPFGIAPNFIINGKPYAVPMVIEESSVVAAASSAAKFWMERGGFQAQVRSTTKVGQVHFLWTGQADTLFTQVAAIKSKLLMDAKHLTARMEARGGGIKNIELLDFTQEEANYYQLKVAFDTKDSMGANFINSVLEQFSTTLLEIASSFPNFSEGTLSIIMAILSNYTPDCLVHAKVSCPVRDLEGACPEMDAFTFAEKFYTAVRIAQIDTYRATTHNKGIYNGIDAVVLATGNDFRAVEACGHTYAARNGKYSSLSVCHLEQGVFTFELEVPMAIGTVGGLTKLHPLAHRALELLGNPSAVELMEIIAAVGLAQNFAAVKSLITTGIQKGHMKMHLQNMLHHLGARNGEMEAIIAYFEDKPVSFAAVRTFLEDLRK
ncbi:MAG: hydroxymethylglutaryl-CoA reductase, degradative [Saprospiraceae bacterium]|nr:hydroxymethylglutaryl-CoA reductase, degradative [Saprospiraceae bacterium]